MRAHLKAWERVNLEIRYLPLITGPEGGGRYIKFGIDSEASEVPRGWLRCLSKGWKRQNLKFATHPFREIFYKSGTDCEAPRLPRELVEGSFEDLGYDESWNKVPISYNRPRGGGRESYKNFGVDFEASRSPVGWLRGLSTDWKRENLKLGTHPFREIFSKSGRDHLERWLGALIKFGTNSQAQRTPGNLIEGSFEGFGSDESWN